MTDANKSALALPPDQRNLHWKSSNIGAKLLGKMGWKDGQAVGKMRRRLDETDAAAAGDRTTAPAAAAAAVGRHVSSEGLRIARRAEGLGVGAERAARAPSAVHGGSGDVHRDFASVLARLNNGAGDGDGDSSSSRQRIREGKRKKKQKKQAQQQPTSISLPTNKTTCHKVRRAKFQEKTEEDMRCIFGSTSLALPPVVVSDHSSSGGGDGSRKRRKSKKTSDDGESRQRKKTKQSD
jgi:hypothetical protein